MTKRIFNPPPGWPQPPEGWQPPPGWTPDPAWPEPPEGWVLWIEPDAEPAPPPPPASAVPTTPADAPVATAPIDIPEPQVSNEQDRLAALEAELARLKQAASQAGDSGSIASDVVELDDDVVLQSVGIYRYHHLLEDAVAFKERLDELSARIAETVKAGRAIEASNMFTFDNSLAKGRKMVNDLSKLMLRAYNAEADNSIRSLRLGNVVTAKNRLERSRTSIAKLGKMMEMHISDEFHQLRIEEIELTADWLMKKQEEKEAAREERARLAEQRRAEQELAAEREKLNKEREHLVNAIEASDDDTPEVQALREKLNELDEAIEHNDFRIANIRAGYVYVISNRGAFGEGVVKIGLTRRLEPLDRVRELSGASVPFPFDVHALFFSEDAVALETDIHQHFANRKLNKANGRKEFFFATPAEVREALATRVGSLLEFTEHADATQFLQSVGSWPEDQQSRIAA